MAYNERMTRVIEDYYSDIVLLNLGKYQNLVRKYLSKSNIKPSRRISQEKFLHQTKFQYAEV